MERYLITKTLIGSWQYLCDCQECAKEGAMEDFLGTLRREPEPYDELPDAIKNGLEFEEEVYREASHLLREPHPKWESGIKAVADALSGSSLQVKAHRDLDVCGTKLLVYGILDGLRAGEIFDVKFCNKSFGSAELAGKYLDSPQHPAYFYIVPEAHRFTYLVSDGEDLYTETYTPESSRPFPDIAREFLAGLDSMGLMDEYRRHWVTKW